MYTVKCESVEGIFYLVNGWGKRKALFVEKVPTKKDFLFSRKQDAKKSVTMLLKLFDEFRGDKFAVVEV